jgi:hypothetical protein
MAKIKYWVVGAGIIILVAIGGIFFYRNSSPENENYISPLKLSPYVSLPETRAIICAKATGAPFKKVCQNKFDKVAKDDAESIDELFFALDQAKNDYSSEYDKFLLSQLVFASLPAWNNTATLNPKKNFLAADFGNFFGESAKAQEFGMSRTQYEARLLESLSAIVQNCPLPGDDAWIITAMCQEYTWIDGERQPIYSKQYGEAGGNCVFTDEGEREAEKLTHTRSIIETKMKNEYNFDDSAKNISNQIACTFSCNSHKCPVPEKSKGKPLNVSIKDYTEPGHKGSDLLMKLLDKANSSNSSESNSANTTNTTATTNCDTTEYEQKYSACLKKCDAIDSATITGYDAFRACMNDCGNIKCE